MFGSIFGAVRNKVLGQTHHDVCATARKHALTPMFDRRCTRIPETSHKAAQRECGRAFEVKHRDLFLMIAQVTPMESHQLHPELLRRKVRVLVVGCGGNGSAIAAGLPYLHQALLVYGHPEGVHVTLLDPDIISPANCVRQPFSRSEIGLYKSVVLANRVNLFWGLDCEGSPELLDGKR